jgi:hypothetical protein
MVVLGRGRGEGVRCERIAIATALSFIIRQREADISDDIPADKLTDSRSRLRNIPQHSSHLGMISIYHYKLSKPQPSG